MICNQCPRQCNIDRELGGYCRVGGQLRIARAELHTWEEPILSGTKGSGTIFFSGCNLRCVYCQNSEISSSCRGEIYSQQDFIDAMRRLEDSGAHNINLVTADHYSLQITEALAKYRPSIPICWNTSSYISQNTLELLDDYVDIYLADLKYMDGALAGRYSKADDYPSIATAAIQRMRQKPDIITDGIMQQGLVVRHLVLPNNIANTLQCLDYIIGNLPHATIVSLMSQYTPLGNVPAELNRAITPLEYKIAVSKMRQSAFENVFVQEGSAVGESFVPKWSGQRL